MKQQFFELLDNSGIQLVGLSTIDCLGIVPTKRRVENYAPNPVETPQILTSLGAFYFRWSFLRVLWLLN